MKSKSDSLTHSLTEWVSELQGHLLSCPGQLKTQINLLYLELAFLAFQVFQLINSSHSCSHPTTNPWDVNLHQEPAMSTLYFLALKSADSDQFHQIQWTPLQCFTGEIHSLTTFMISRVPISMKRTVVQLPTLITRFHQNQWAHQQYFQRGNTTSCCRHWVSLD